MRVRPEFLWYLHLNEPACVVGEHMQLYFTLDAFLKAVGVEGVEDGNGCECFIASTYRFNFFFLVCAMSIDC